MALISQAELMQFTGIKTRPKLARELGRAGIPFFQVAGQILTTEAAMTAALVDERVSAPAIMPRYDRRPSTKLRS